MELERIEIEHRKKLVEIAERIPKGVPDGWEKTGFAVGGLMYLGFSERCPELLISISSQGQRVINCRTWEKLYCEENYDEEDLVACAEILGDELVPIAGMGGGGLRQYAKNGDILEKIAPYWPKEQIIFMPKYISWLQKPEECMVIYEDSQMRAFGFSRCGNYMAAGSSSTLEIFRRII